jgi:hypothetical protein
MRGVMSPPLEPLRAVVASLEGAGIGCALGGSGLLASLGLADHVGDWDLTVDAPARQVYPHLDAGRLTYVGSDPLHADEKLQIEADRIEIICGFAFHVNSGIVRLPAMACGRWEGIPTASPEVWAVAYALLDRAEKRDVLFGHLERSGARPRVVAALLAQPLPGELGDRLRRLPAGDFT